MSETKETVEEPKPVDVSSEIDSMLKSLNEETQSAEIPKENEENKEAKVEEEKEIVEEPKLEEKKSETTPVEKKETTPEPDEKDKTISELRTKLAEATTKPPENKAPATTTEPEPEEQDFVADLDMDDLTRDPKELNKLLNKVARHTTETTRKSLGESVIKSIPDIVRANVDQLRDMEKMRTKFYGDNKDLEPFPKVVATVFEELAAANTDKTYNQVMDLVAPEARKRLELHKTATSNAPGEKKTTPPKLPTVGGRSGKSSSSKPDTIGIENELDDMNKSLGR